MSRLIKIAGCKGIPRANVIFVHGLGGHAYDTWRRNDETFWPVWLAQDIPGVSIYTVAYTAPPTNWLGTSMPLQDRAVNILEHFFSEVGLRSGPIVLVCHSLGGLLAKQVMLNLQQQKDFREEAAGFLERVSRIVFIATPHTGAHHASLLEHFRFLAWPSTIARVLVANDPTLRQINTAYRGLAQSRRETLHHRIFYETRDMAIGRIVDEAGADPGLPGDPPIPIDADHISIVKPSDRSELLYRRTKDFINQIPAHETLATDFPALPQISFEQPSYIIPKFIRVVFIILTGFTFAMGADRWISPTRPPDAQELGRLNDKLDRIAERLVIASAHASPERIPSVEAAVRSTAAAAREGNKDSREALELLEKNEVPEATERLEAFADGKASSIQRDSKDAAIAYQHVGAIAGLQNPKKAIEAYQKSLQYAPNDAESLYWFGWLNLQAGHLTAAEEALKKLLAVSVLSKDPQGVYRANIRLGETAQLQGDVESSLEHILTGLQTAIDQHGLAPNDDSWARNLSTARNKMGGVKRGQGDIAGALKEYEEGLRIRRKLAEAKPQDLSRKRDVAVSLNDIGNLQVEQQDHISAERSYLEALSIAIELERADPRNAQWKRDLAVNYNNIGDLKLAGGAAGSALESYKKSFGIMSALADSDQNNMEWQRDLSIVYEEIGDALMLAGNSSKALDSYVNAHIIRERLSKIDPHNETWLRDLAVSHEKIGDAAHAGLDVVAAKHSYEDALKLRRQLASRNMPTPDLRHELAISYLKLAKVLGEQRSIDPAKEMFSEGRSILSTLVAVYPSKKEWKDQLALAEQTIGSQLSKRKQKRESR